MSQVIEYRGLAANLRREAQIAMLPNVRGMKLKAAECWEAMAQEIENTIRPSGKSLADGWIF